MKVLIIQGSDNKVGGGVESFVSIFSRNKKVKDVKFTILYPSTTESDKKLEEEGRIVYFPIRIPFNQRSRIFKSIDLLLFNIYLLFAKEIFAEHYDVIHINGLAGALVSLRFPERSLFTIHGNALASFMGQRSIYNKSQLALNFFNSLLNYSLELLASRWSRIVVAVSPSVKDKFARVIGRNIVLVRNGIEFQNVSGSTREEIEKTYNIDRGSFICLWVGRNAERKGLNTAINSLIDNKNAYLFVVGIEKSVSSYVNTNIIYCGNLPKVELDKLYATADLLIFPSRYEAMSYTVIEALSFGLPVVAFKKDFITDIVGMEYPLLCDKEEEFKIRINNFITWGNEDIKRIRELSIAISRNFNADIMAEKYVELYRVILNEEQ